MAAVCLREWRHSGLQYNGTGTADFVLSDTVMLVGTLFVLILFLLREVFWPVGSFCFTPCFFFTALVRSLQGTRGGLVDAVCLASLVISPVFWQTSSKATVCCGVLTSAAASWGKSLKATAFWGLLLRATANRGPSFSKAEFCGLFSAAACSGFLIAACGSRPIGKVMRSPRRDLELRLTPIPRRRVRTRQVPTSRWYRSSARWYTMGRCSSIHN